jgi:hypothetical protein
MKSFMRLLAVSGLLMFALSTASLADGGAPPPTGHATGPHPTILKP